MYDNPFVKPCKCAGTMGIIHIECLREWLSSKKSRRTLDFITTYCWKGLECELCHTKFPHEMRVLNQDKRKVNLIDYPVPEGIKEYLILESVTQ
jgi:E3 ubiquitin-protein ligase DOA10